MSFAMKEWQNTFYEKIEDTNSPSSVSVVCLRVRTGIMQMFFQSALKYVIIAGTIRSPIPRPKKSGMQNYERNPSLSVEIHRRK